MSSRVLSLVSRIATQMAFPARRRKWKLNGRMKFSLIAFAGIALGFILANLFRANFSFVRTSSLSNLHDLKIWDPANPRGAERLAPGFFELESDLYLHRLWGQPSEDLTVKPKYLVAFIVDYTQRDNIDAAVKNLSENFTILLFHTDGWATLWNEFKWSKRAIHVSARQQSKWWFAKRFLHPDIVAPYEYIFIWGEDLAVERFDAEEYLKLMRTDGRRISQPGPEINEEQMISKAEDKPDCCEDPKMSSCQASVEITSTVFSGDAWRSVWHMIQNDLVHGWGLDTVLREYVEPAHEKIKGVDAQWIVHESLPSLNSQEREWCRKEWMLFHDRLTKAEKAYYEISSFRNTSAR